MALTSSISITPFDCRYRQRLDDLLYRSYHVHMHLDWHEAGDWLSVHAGLGRLAWHDNRLAGLLVVSEPLHCSGWVRLAAVDDAFPARPVLEAMWRALLPDLRAAGLQTVTALVARAWLEDHLASLGFAYDEDVVTMQRSGPPPPTTPVAGLALRPTAVADLALMAAVDHAAFAPPWQLSLADLSQALRIASSGTVAVIDGALVGYQISTLYRDGAHLARLAVAPAVQGQGVGAALVTDVIERFAQRGIATMTVNTQASNQRSQRLYRRLGFHHNGYDLPVWSAPVPPA